MVQHKQTGLAGRCIANQGGQADGRTGHEWVDLAQLSPNSPFQG